MTKAQRLAAQVAAVPIVVDVAMGERQITAELAAALGACGLQVKAGKAVVKTSQVRGLCVGLLGVLLARFLQESGEPLVWANIAPILGKSAESLEADGSVDTA